MGSLLIVRLELYIAHLPIANHYATIGRWWASSIIYGGRDQTVRLHYQSLLLLYGIYSIRKANKRLCL